MKAVVIGAAGQTGRQIVSNGLRRGYEITAFTRRPQEFANMKGLRSVVSGDGLNLADVKVGLKDQDAVICSVAGSRGTSWTITNVIRNVITAMTELKVNRLIFISSSLIDATRPLLMVEVVKWLLRHHIADSMQAELLLRESELDWTIIRPTRLTNQPGVGHVRRIYGGTIDSAPYRLTRADLASSIWETVVNEAEIGAVFEISEARLRLHPNPERKKEIE